MRQAIEPEQKRRIKEWHCGWESREMRGRKTERHTYSLINISLECGPIVNHSPGNNCKKPLSLFLICCQSFSGHSETQSGGKKQRDELGFTLVCLVCGWRRSVDVWAWTVREKRVIMIRLAKVLMLAPLHNPWGEMKILDWSKGRSPLPLTRCLLIACPFLWALNASKPALLRTRTRYKRRISLGVKTVPPFWSHRFQGYWGLSNFSTLALQICPAVTVHRAAGLHGGPAAWPSLNYLTSGRINLRLFIDLIPSRSISSFIQRVWNCSASVVTVNESSFSIDLGLL